MCSRKKENREEIKWNAGKISFLSTILFRTSRAEFMTHPHKLILPSFHQAIVELRCGKTLHIIQQLVNMWKVVQKCAFSLPDLYSFGVLKRHSSCMKGGGCLSSDRECLSKVNVTFFIYSSIKIIREAHLWAMCCFTLLLHDSMYSYEPSIEFRWRFLSIHAIELFSSEVHLPLTSFPKIQFSLLIFISTLPRSHCVPCHRSWKKVCKSTQMRARAWEREEGKGKYYNVFMAYDEWLRYIYRGINRPLLMKRESSTSVLHSVNTMWMCEGGRMPSITSVHCIMCVACDGMISRALKLWLLYYYYYHHHHHHWST